MMRRFTFLKFAALTCFTLFLAMGQIHAQSEQYLHFDKMDDFVEVPMASKYIANGNGLTVTGWFYCDELSYGQGMFGFRNGGSGDGQMYMIQLDNGILENRYITIGGFSEYVSPAFTVLPEVWQHYAWVWDGTNVSLYLDGNLVGSSPSNSTAITSPDTPFSIGSHISPFNFYFGGRIDEISVWSKALSIGEIQDMVANELEGDEANLELYYKFNQGVPGGDNTSLTMLKCEVGDGERDGILKNFALNGETSNFGGELDESFQAISFPQISDKLITDAPFNLGANASSGLEIVYSIVSGPASVAGNTITLDGTVGEVVVRASQPGDGSFDPAEDVENSFMVLDPNTFVPAIDVRAPLNNVDFYAPNLGPIRLAAISSIGSPELFDVSSVKFEINGEIIDAKDWGNEHYTAWWTPPAMGTYNMAVISTNNYGASNTTTITFDIVDNPSFTSLNAATDIHLDVNISEEIVTAELPTYLGAFDNIVANLDIGCPGGGCDPWDRISGVEVKGHDGEWYEIIRYITPYGIACNHSVDLTDFMSLLYGKVDFKFTLGTQGNGFLYTLDFDFSEGTPSYPYSRVDKLWNATYDFGDMSNLQPYEDKVIQFSTNTEVAKVKLVATGHGWGDNNTGNAAEFHEDTHHLLINDVAAYAHQNWLDCDPNPDGCNDQLGTWYFNRAGWCPGAIAPWNDFDVTSYISANPIDLNYRLDEDYIDFCNASNPDCVSGVTCDNCNDGFDPHLITASYLISLGENPFDDNSPVAYKEVESTLPFSVFPNPSSGMVQLEYDVTLDVREIRIVSSIGSLVRNQDLLSPTGNVTLDLHDLAPGLYFVELRSKTSTGIQRLVIE